MQCANCGYSKEDRFCPRCGQNDRDYARSFVPVVWEILKETFEVDSRLWRTIRNLLIRPGYLTVEFARNRRASYVTPIRLYIVASLAFFFLVSLKADFEPLGRIAEVESEVQAHGPEQIEALKSRVGEKRRAKIDAILGRQDRSMTKLALLGVADETVEKVEFTEFETTALGYFIDVLDEPEVAFGKLIDNLPIGMFFLLPFYTLVLALFYVTKRRYLAEHLVFAVHVHTFAFLVFTALVALPDVEGLTGPLPTLVEALNAVLFLALIVYGYLALKRFYGDGHVMTVFKFCTISFIYLLALGPAVFGVITLTLMML